jgi:hypothetical protein
MLRLAACQIILFMTLIIMGCSSNSGNPITNDPGLSQDNRPIPNINLPEFLTENSFDSNHDLLGTWEIHFDTKSLTTEIVPNRGIESHFNVTSIIPPPSIVINSYNPASNIIDVDVTISNPYPVDVFDVRLIIFTDSIGHQLLNPDNWTPLYDISGGLPINPFKAYAKDQVNRVFAGQTQHTANLQIYLPQGNPNVTFAIDASYPGNCEEPYKIGNLLQEVLYDEVGSSAICQVEVYDHQSNVNSVNLYCPLITGTTLVPFSCIGLNEWELELINVTGVSAGIYDGYLIAGSENSGFLVLYNKVNITITQKTGTGWARTWGGDLLDKGACSTVDDLGNIYVFGYFSGTCDFNPGSGFELLMSNGGTDIFLSKFDKDGDFIWARTWGSSDNDNYDDPNTNREHYLSRGAETDSSGNIYVSGNFRGTVDFAPGAGEDLHTSNGGSDIFLSKFDPNGNFLLARTWGGTLNHENSQDNGNDLAIDESGDVYITGRFYGMPDFDPGPDEFLLSSVDGSVFMSKFNMDGVFKWAVNFGGDHEVDEGNGVEVSNSGNILVTGAFSGTGDFNPGEQLDIRSSIGWLDAFLSMFTPDGDFVWAKTWGGDNSNWCDGMEVITDTAGNIFVGGGFLDYSPVDFDPGTGIDEEISNGSFDAYISKFDLDGNFQWVITWGNTNQNHCLDLAYDGSTKLYAVSRFVGIMDFDPGEKEDFHEAISNDAALSKFNTDGEFIWARTWGWLESDKAYDVSTDNTGNIYVTGFFGGGEGPFYPPYIVDFDPGPDEDMRTSEGDSDIFLVKFLPNGYWE